MKKITKEQKSNLAKLLATENLNIEHRKVKTAYFIPKTRTLCLPIWKEMSNDLYDLLCGHEVGHALYTPQSEEKLKKSMKGVPHSYFNVVEDIRIDKKMKLKYPGLRKSYFNGYRELVEKDFFGTKSNEINKMRFIDRLNMFTKSGNMEDIEFNDIENGFIEKSNHLNTFEDVIKLAKEIFKYSEEKEEYNPEEDGLNSKFNIDPEGDYEVETDPTSSNEGQDTEQEQEQDNSGDNSDEEAKEEEKTEKSKEQEKENDGEEKANPKNGGQKAGHNPDVDAGILQSDNEALTDANYNNEIKNMAKTAGRDNHYVTLPKVKNEAVIPWKQVLKLFKDKNDRQVKDEKFQNKLNFSTREFKKFKQENMKTVSYMVKEFEMKKAADSYKKSQVAKTGSLNMNKLHSYKFNEDVFKKIQTDPSAKNHGMNIFVDWSGSMSNNMYDTIAQTLNLVWFCKAIQIPFEVYAFTDVNRQSFYPTYDKDGHLDYSWSKGRYSNPPFIFDKENQLMMENVSLINFVSSEMRAVDFQTAMLNLYRVSCNHRDYFDNTIDWQKKIDLRISYPSMMRLGGTPLDPCIIVATKLVNEFQKKYKVQKMNTIFLTDGCGHTNTNYTKLNKNYDPNSKNIDKQDEYMPNYKDESNLVVIDKDSKMQIEYGSGWGFKGNHKPMFELFKAKTGSTLIGFYITARNRLSYNDIAMFTEDGGYSDVDKMRKEIKKNKVGLIENFGYDELYIIPRLNLKITDGELNVNENMTPAVMKREFLKTLKTKKTSRVLLNKFVEKVA
jgi:hypothetical protein